MAEPLSGPGLETLLAASIRIGAAQGQPAHDTDRADGCEHGEVMAVHLIFQCTLSELIEAVKLQETQRPSGRIRRWNPTASRS